MTVQTDTVTIASIGSISNGAYSAPSSLLDNTPTGSPATYYGRGRLRLTFSSPITAGSGTPNIWIFRLVAANATDLPNPPGTSAAAPAPTAPASIMQQVASAAFSIVDFPEFDMGPFKYGYQILNQTGANFSGTPVLTLYRWAPIAA